MKLVPRLCSNRKSRRELLSTAEASWATTKSVGMWFIQPDTEIMQSHPRRQADLKPPEVMGPFTIEAEGMPELLIHGLDDLTHPGKPAPKPLGPRPSASALRWADPLGPIGLPPRRMMGLALKAFVDHIRPQSGSSHTRQPRMG